MNEPTVTASALHVAARFEELRGLKAGWETGAEAIDAGALAHVERALQEVAAGLPDFHAPEIVPKMDGFVQLEWHRPERFLEVEYLPDGWALMGGVPNDDDCLFYGADAALSDFAALRRAYEWFAGNGPAPADWTIEPDPVEWVTETLSRHGLEPAESSVRAEGCTILAFPDACATVTIHPTGEAVLVIGDGETARTHELTAADADEIAEQLLAVYFLDSSTFPDSEE